MACGVVSIPHRRKFASLNRVLLGVHAGHAMPDQGHAAFTAMEHDDVTAQAVLPLVDAASAMPATTAGHLPTSQEAGTLRADSYAAFTSQQPPIAPQSHGNDLRLSSFGGFASGSVATLSTGGALAHLATAVLAQDGGQTEMVQQLKQMRHMHSQQDEQRSPHGSSALAASTALLNLPSPPLNVQRPSNSVASARSAASDVSGRSDGEPASSSPPVRPKALRPAARQNAAAHATSSLPGQWPPCAPGSTGASPVATPKSAGQSPLRSAASAPDQLQLSPGGLHSGQASPHQQSLTGGTATPHGGGSCSGAFTPVDRKATASAPIIVRSSSVSSGEVRCSLSVAKAANAVVVVQCWEDVSGRALPWPCHAASWLPRCHGTLPTAEHAT